MSTSTQRPLTLQEKLPEIFTYHSPVGDQTGRYLAVRTKALEMAKVIITCTKPCADQTAAIRLLREAVMTANAAIALDGLV